jgi:multisubunit Na+/H+ antiporter MnhF subunit
MDFNRIVILVLIIYSLAGLYRVLRGPTIWDRMLGSALFSSKVIIIAILIGMLINRSFAVDVALIYAVFGFIGTIMIARFVERRGDI